MMLIVYHVISITKFMRCLKQGFLPFPVHAWENIEEAERFSKQTGRAMILRLRFPHNAQKLKGHRNKAYVSYQNHPLSQPFNGYECRSKV